MPGTDDHINIPKAGHLVNHTNSEEVSARYLSTDFGLDCFVRLRPERTQILVKGKKFIYKIKKCWYVLTVVEPMIVGISMLKKLYVIIIFPINHPEYF